MSWAQHLKRVFTIEIDKSAGLPIGILLTSSLFMVFQVTAIDAAANRKPPKGRS